MKIAIISFFFGVLWLGAFAQAPEAFMYQAIVRDESGNALMNKPVSFQFAILKGTPSGVTTYSEKHYVSTDTFGSVTLVIGNGTEKLGDFETIDWGSDKWFLNVSVDTLGGNAFTDMSTTQFLSVPYAFYTNLAANGFSGDYNDLRNRPVTDGSETKIVPANNITLTGSGRAGDPYVIDEKPHYPGETYGGGIIFFVYDNGRHGLISSVTDQDQGIQWYNGVKRYTNAAGDGVGVGKMNTFLIIALQTNDNQVGNFAAKVCEDYSVTVDGVTYGDWYLPSKYEMGLMFFQKDLIGGLNEDYYWSSTEFSSVSAWCMSFSTGTQQNLNKSLPYRVRAIRAF